MKRSAIALAALAVLLASAAKAEDKPADPAPAAAAPAVKPEPAKAPSGKPKEGLDAEWTFLQQAVKDGSAIGDAAYDDLKAFVGQHPDAPMRADALSLLASLRQKRGESKAAIVDYLSVVYEFPDSDLATQAKAMVSDLADKKLPKKAKAGIGELLKPSEGGDKSSRLAELAGRLSEAVEDALYDPSVDAIRAFQGRFPAYAHPDKIQWDLAALHDKGGKPAAAVLAYEKLLAVYPSSDARAKAQFAIGALYADSLRDYKKAVDAFQQVVADYPDAPEVLSALERTAQLYADKLKQYELAADVHEKIIKRFPKTDAALRSFNGEARLQREKFNQPGAAIKTWLRLTEQFGAPAAVDALENAADTARKDLKDYAQEAELRRRIGKDYAASKDAAAQVFAAAEVYEDDLKDTQKAFEAYQEVESKFPGTKQAQKAQERAAKLENKK